jgi:hypothetical protein
MSINSVLRRLSQEHLQASLSYVVRPYLNNKIGLMEKKNTCQFIPILDFFFSFFFAVLVLELKAFTLSHSTSPIFVKGFSRQGLLELFAQAGFKLCCF